MNSFPREPFTAKTFFGYISLLVFLFLSFWAGLAIEVSPSKLLSGIPYMTNFISRTWPPNLEVLPKVFEETLLTIQIAWVATVFCALLSLPIAFMAASNTCRSSFLRTAILFVLNAVRSIDVLFLALFFVSAVGLGPFPGAIAVAINSVGMLAKLFADSIEAIDPGPMEALESAGAGRLATIRWAVWPQVVPQFISFTLFRFELNVRAAMVLGLVGAGGIGFLFQQYMRLFQYQKVATVILVIMGLVMFLDFFSSKLRKSVL